MFGHRLLLTSLIACHGADDTTADATGGIQVGAVYVQYQD